MRIYLIGFMGCGKSTFGKKLANKLGCTFYDTDKVIEEIEGGTVAELFALKGEEYFRKLESNVLHQTFIYEKAVISCGGGTPCYFDNMDWMKSRGRTLYLRLRPERLHERLRNKKDKRPLIAKFNDEQLKDFIFQKLSEREVYYLKADLIINPEITSAKKIASEIKMWKEI